MNMSHCSSKIIGPMYVEVSGRSARNVPGSQDFLWFRPSLDIGFLQIQLIQNLCNLLELNKIYMEHSAKLNLFPRSWWSKCEIMAVNIVLCEYCTSAHAVHIANARSERGCCWIANPASPPRVYLVVDFRWEGSRSQELDGNTKTQGFRRFRLSRA